MVRPSAGTFMPEKWNSSVSDAPLAMDITIGWFANSVLLLRVTMAVAVWGCTRF